MLDIHNLASIGSGSTIIYGNHPGIIQSVLDFDFMVGKNAPSIQAVVGVQQRKLRYFWGEREITIDGYAKSDLVPDKIKKTCTFFIIVQSGRRVLSSVQEVTSSLKKIQAGVIFAEGVPEQHALLIRSLAKKYKVAIFGPSSVGMVIPGKTKLGAIGGITPSAMEEAGILEPGFVSVISSSGGMVNELINMTAKNGGRISFAAAIGGERYPAITPVEMLQASLKDPHTKTVLYFGELGGSDEYDIADYLKNNPTKKTILAYVAGTIAEYFDTPPQFGHAKAMASNKRETASSKKDALREVGVRVCDGMAEFEEELKQAISQYQKPSKTVRIQISEHRKSSLFVSRISQDKGGSVQLLGSPLVEKATSTGFSALALELLLGKKITSPTVHRYFEDCLKILIDHGPQVSGAVTSMITARAGRDLATALASGLLTIGSRFGGAINAAALNWLTAAENGETPYSFVERIARSGQYIQGIGHKKYRLDNPDPRVQYLCEQYDIGGQYLAFARGVEAVTVSKKAQLILNVDGAIAALALDLLQKKAKMDNTELKELINIEFFNAIFILSRSFGFTAHILEQKRLDEGLFRLPDDLVSAL